MVFVSKIDESLSTLSVVVQSKDGDLVALEEDLEAADTPKLCRLDLQELAEASLLRPDPAALAVVFVEDSAVLLAVAVFEEVSEVLIGAALVVEEVVSDIKAEVALVEEEVGMEAGRLMATVMAKQHPQMHLLALAETVEALAVGIVALLRTVV